MTRALFVLLPIVWGSCLMAAEDPLEKASALIRRHQHAAAVEALDAVLAQQPTLAPAYYLRGASRFRSGDAAGSVADFERYIELEPKAEARLWELGISYYYEQKFAQGARQFDLYQTFYSEDVENAFWKWMCVAGDKDLAAAGKTLLPIRRDRRPPLMTVYALIQGKAKPEEVLADADKADSDESRFFAHLYLGLYYDTLGKPAEAKKHIALAAGKYYEPHYMGDVAKAHARKLGLPEEKLDD